MSIFDIVRAKCNAICANVKKYKAEKIWVFGSYACGRGRFDRYVGRFAEYELRYNLLIANIVMTGKRSKKHVCYIAMFCTILHNIFKYLGWECTEWHHLVTDNRKCVKKQA